MLTGLPLSTILLVTGFGLALIGIWGILAHRHLMRIIIGFVLLDTGFHIVMVATGYVTGGTAPIVDKAFSTAEAMHSTIDPVPSALVVTAIVIGMSVTAVMLAFAIRLYESKKTLSIDAFTESKW
ncbi:sodium:proton antiporter [Nitrobacter winogradskyi]|uniref:Multicomponent Na+:H+ antiporter subunit C n=2 Tax=Nitrobacter winogradskyi TaxID=913 RepID=A0ACC6APR0_NITWI|nr:cation:proton antiporter subunit C [Nitrobacter winogradskyi]MCP2000955.1 multicomponent Na+:H+ antiporter subunit C [Nitrobacter winogradskyi]GEC17273.1 cation:proton antiporter [Nitrobacter winogradskyi]